MIFQEKWDKLIRFFISMYALFAMVSLVGSNIVIVLALACWAAKSVSGGKLEFRSAPVDIPLVSFIAAVGLSVIFSTSFRSSFAKYDSMWIVCIYFLASNNTS